VETEQFAQQKRTVVRFCKKVRFARIGYSLSRAAAATTTGDI
jgi:hypothetical protein